MIDEQTQSFIDKYRDALGVQRDISLQSAENARRNAYQSIMSNANTAGMMYSNFPERSKIQYDTNVYLPSREKAQTSYQTGLDDLRNKVTDSINSIAHYNDEIRALNEKTKNEKAQSNLPEGARLLNDAGDYMFLDAGGGTQYRNAKGENIRFGTSAKRSGFTSNEDILRAARLSLNDDAYSRLLNAWYQARLHGLGNIAYNVGDEFEMPGYSWLEDPENDFIGSLGLKFVQ